MKANRTEVLSKGIQRVDLQIWEGVCQVSWLEYTPSRSRRTRRFRQEASARCFAEGLLEGLDSRAKTANWAEKPPRLIPTGETVAYALRFGQLTKIGITADFERRVAELRHANRAPMEEVASLVFATRIEAENFETRLHAQFSTNREGGEWFRVPDSVLRDAFSTACHE